MAESGSLSSADEDSCNKESQAKYYIMLKLNFAENVDNVQHNDKKSVIKA